MIFSCTMPLRGCLRIADVDDWERAVTKFRAAPKAILIEAESEKDVKAAVKLAPWLINQGRCHIVCAGSLSENLHDLLDDSLCESSLRSEVNTEIVTTWHDEDEDAVHYFLHLTNTDLKEDFIWLALLGSNRGPNLLQALVQALAESESQTGKGVARTQVTEEKKISS